MSDTNIAILIEAQNRATAELARLGGDLDRFQKRAVQGSNDLGRETANVDRQSQSLARTLTTLASTFARELDPAFGRATGRMRELGGGAGLLGGALRVLGVAGVVAAVAIREYAQVMEAANQRTAQLHLAVKSLDFQGVVGGLRSATVELEAFDKSFRGMFLSGTKSFLGGSPSQFLATGLDKVLGRDALQKFIEDSRRDAAVTSGSVLGVAKAQARGTFEAAYQGRFQSAVGFSIEDPNSNVALADITTAGARLSKSIEAEAEAQRTALRLKADQEIASLTAIGLGNLTGLVGERLKLELNTIGQAYEGKLVALAKFVEDTRRKVLDADIERQFGRQAREEAPFAEAVGAGGPLTADQAKDLREGAIDRAVARKQIDRDRLQIAGQLATLGQSERTTLELQRIEVERLMAVELARKDLVDGIAKEELANLDAKIKASNAEQARLERTNVVAGIGKAVREIGEDWAAVGVRADESLKAVASSMQQTLAGVFAGDKVGKTFIKDFGDSVKRGLANELSRYIVGSLVSAAGGAVSGPLGSAGLNVTGASPGQLSNLLQQGYQLIGGGGVGGGVGGYLSNGTLTGPGGVSVASPGGGSNFPTGAGLLEYGIDYGFQAANAAGLTQYGSLLAYQQAQGVQQGSALSYGRTSLAGEGGIGGTGIGAQGGFAAYAAIAARAYMGIMEAVNSRGYSAGEQIIQQTHNVGLAVADYFTGGLAELGPLIGNAIGGDFGRFLALGPGAFIRPAISRRVREAISVRDVFGPYANEFIARINRTTTAEELFATLVQTGSGYTGGTTERLAIRTWVAGKIIGNDRGVYAGAAYATVDDLLNSPETIVVQADYGVSQHFLDDVNRAVEEAIKAKVAELNARLSPLPFGFVERGYFKDAAGIDDRSRPYLTKTTQLVGGALTLGQLTPGTQDLFFSREIYREMGVDDATIDSMIRRMNTYTMNRDMLTDLSRERFLAAFGGR